MKNVREEIKQLVMEKVLNLDNAITFDEYTFSVLYHDGRLYFFEIGAWLTEDYETMSDLIFHVVKWEEE